MRSFKVMLFILICALCLIPITNGSASAKTTSGKFTIQNGVGFLFSTQKVISCKEDPDMSFGVNTIKGIRYYTLFPLCRFAEYEVKPDATTLVAKFNDAKRLGDQGFPRQGYYYAFQAYSTKKYYLLHVEQIKKLPGSFEENWRLTFTWQEIQ